MLRTVLLLALVLVGVAAAEPASRSTRNKLLVISFDGFRREYLSRGLTPTFDKLIKQGVIPKKVVPVWPTFTQPAHYSMVTGRHPGHHGVVANTFFEPRLGRVGFFFEGYNPHPDFWNYNNTEPIWISATKQGLRAVGYYWSGTNIKFPDENGKLWEPEESWSKLAERPWEVTVRNAFTYFQNGVDLALLHWSYPDKTGHEFGPDTVEVNDTLRDVDNKLDFLLDQLPIYGLQNNLNILIVSDHGMSKIRKVVNVGLDYNISQTEYLPWTWGGFLFMDPSSTGNAHDLYNRLKRGHEDFDLYFKEDLPKRYFYDKNPRVSKLVLIGRDRAGLKPGGDSYVFDELVPIVKESLCGISNLTIRNVTLNFTGADICREINRYNMTVSEYLHNYATLYPGNHGFDNLDPEMEPIFIASGPDFKRGVEIGTVNQEDYYELMTSLLGIKPQPHDGTVANFKDGLLPRVEDSAATCRYPVWSTLLMLVLLSIWIRP